MNVCDGRLTIDAKSGINTKLLLGNQTKPARQINLLVGEPAQTPTSYTRDTGSLGTTRAAMAGCARTASPPSHTPLNITSNLADRDPYEPMGTRRSSTPSCCLCRTGGSIETLEDPGAFEIAVPCSTYSVTVSVGDSAYSSLDKKPGEASIHRINVEGVNAIGASIPPAPTSSRGATHAVTVCDGRLTIDAIGGTNTKLNYIDVTRVS